MHPEVTIDLNADLGEGLPHDAGLLKVVTSANVACGGHAGGGDLLRRTLDDAAAAGVRVGAHPGYPDPGNFGRVSLPMSPDALRDTLEGQLDVLYAAAEARGIRVAYLKPHGALYHDVRADPHGVGAVVLAVAAARGLPLLHLPGGAESSILAAARARGVRVYAEGFADRRYLPDGSLQARPEPGAVLTDPAAVGTQAHALATRQNLSVVGGSRRAGAVDSICVHGDTPGALALAAAVRARLEAAGLLLQSFVP